MARKKKVWRYKAGRRPFTVAVEEFEPGGILYVRMWIPEEQKYRHRSLRHRDKQRAMAYADELTVRLREGSQDVLGGEVTIERLFRLYHEHRTPAKAKATQLEDLRRMTLFARFFGPRRRADRITLGEWEKFIAVRGRGAIDSKGQEVEQGDRRPVRTRTVQADLIWLRAVLRWGTRWRSPKGHYLLNENPVRGCDLPRERNPRRPVATEDRYEKVLAVSDEVAMQVYWSGRPEAQRSHLRELLILANGTGRRISAILRLSYADLRLKRGPHGSIQWPAATDKMKRETLVPVSIAVRTAIDQVLRDRPGVGDLPLFPSPQDVTKPTRYELAAEWLREAEERAGLTKQDGGLWHPYRRKWATERKHLPDVDVAAAGGWLNPRTLVDLYQQPDDETLFRVVSDPTQLREVR